MRYDLKNPLHKKNARAYFDKLCEKGAVVEVTEKVQRTLAQNSYLHLIISYFACQIGETMEYCKEHYYKYACNKDIFLATHKDKVTGNKVQILRSSRDLSKEEMTLSITRFKDWAAMLPMPIVLPDADKPEEILAAQNEVYSNREYL